MPSMPTLAAGLSQVLATVPLETTSQYSPARIFVVGADDRETES
jgi:hypothetical protein